VIFVSNDINHIRSKQRDIWATGDFSIIGRNTAYPGETLIESTGVSASQRIIDVACGSGNLALSAARRNCAAYGIDYVPALIDRAKARAIAEGLSVDFSVSDCEQIPFEDNFFDRVFSIFGAMFSPDPIKASNELIRICKPGGKVALGNWVPEGFWGEAFSVLAHFSNLPKLPNSPLDWGREFFLNELFGTHCQFVQYKKRTAYFRYESVDHWIEVFTKNFGPLMSALRNLEIDKQQELIHKLREILSRFNVSEDTTLVVGADYLEVVMVKN
jgi:ubiquinone/menaquinone biosynthesis C-methylase UbiE